MRVKLHPSLPLLLLIGLSAACGDPDEPTDEQSNPSLQTTEGGLPEAGGFVPPAGADAGALPSGGGLVDAGAPLGFDAATQPLDAGGVITGTDGGGGPLPVPDGGSMASSDAGRDAALGADTGASGCTLTYENFGKQFMTMYCATCHTGLFAGHGVMLDSLAGVQRNKAAIKQQAVTGTAMPQANPKPTSAERQQLGQWLDCGPN